MSATPGLFALPALLSPLKSTAVLLLVFIVNFGLRRRSAALRHLIWLIAFLAIALLPVLSGTVPALRIRSGLAGPSSSSLVFSTAVSQNSPAGPASDRLRGDAPLGRHRNPAPFRWSSFILGVWLAGAAVCLARMAAAYRALARVRRQAALLPIADLPALARAVGLSHGVEVRATAPGTMPMTCGLLRPCVLLPSDCQEWSAGRLRAVLLHELAHVRRRDPLTHLIARAALSLYWWNPLAWFAWTRCVMERERAADDLVLLAGTQASAYAETLLAVARSMQAPAGLGLAVAMARRSHLESRLGAILDPKRNRRGSRTVDVILAIVAALALIVPLSALQLTPGKVPSNIESAVREAITSGNPVVLRRAAAMAEGATDLNRVQETVDAELAGLARQFGAGSADYGEALFNAGQLEQKWGRYEQAEKYDTDAGNLLRSTAKAAPVLVSLGEIALVQKQNGRATDLFRQAQAADPVNAGRALMWLALLSEREHDALRAEQLFREALSKQISGTQDAAITAALLAGFLDRSGRQSEAAALRQQASGIEKALGEQVRTAGLPPGVYRIGNGIAPPKLISKIEPEYSEEARAAKYEGIVVLTTQIGADGRAHNTDVIQGLGLGLDERAVAAVGQWTFQPAVRNGEPVTVAATIEVNWRLF